MSKLAAFSILGLTAALAAQPNIRPGTEVTNTIGALGSPGATAGGRFGTFPSGRQAWGITTTSCNLGTVNVPWLRDMNIDHPSIGMWMYREYNGRFEQISEFRGVKHGFTSTNSPGCGSCPGGAGSSLVVGCTDTYGASLNYSHSWMAPPSEINPWTGIWTSVGSHFDRGFPIVAPPNNTDNVRSTINFPNNDPGYRNLVWDSKLNVTGATFWVTAYYNVTGEPDAVRENNADTRQFTATWGGTQWNWANPNSTHFQTPAIYRWTGATVNSALNGTGADGRFYVAVKVTGPTNGVYHYEYAVFNRDNNRQGGAVRIPMCAGATMTNVYFGDPDQTTTNDWTVSRTATHLVFTAPTGNANNLSWGNLFNFAFDCDAAPATGLVSVDQALAGLGNPSVDVSSNCPLDSRNLFLGSGCGSPTPPVLAANSQARLGNATFALNVRDVAANSTNMFLIGASSTNLALGPCTIFVDPAQLLLQLPVSANGSGVATLQLPVPNDINIDGSSIAVQVAEVQVGGAFNNQLDFSSGLKVKFGVLNAGCN